MDFTFVRLRDRRISWRRDLPPVLVVAGLAADYLSPPALWTMLLPFGVVVLLIGLRRWVHAAAVFLLCSWVLIPTAASGVSAMEEMQGDARLYLLPDAMLPTVIEAVDDPCVPNDVGFEVLPIGSDHLMNPRWALRDAITTFADLHNAMLIDRWHDAPTGACSSR